MKKVWNVQLNMEYITQNLQTEDACGNLHIENAASVFRWKNACISSFNVMKLSYGPEVVRSFEYGSLRICCHSCACNYLILRHYVRGNSMDKVDKNRSGIIVLHNSASIGCIWIYSTSVVFHQAFNTSLHTSDFSQSSTLRCSIFLPLLNTFVSIFPSRFFFFRTWLQL